ncbi:MAG: MarR family winged helix-turn-helix transcriptional regulator [Thermoleophilaceae bacterium]
MARAPRSSLSSLLAQAQRWASAAERSNSGRSGGLARAQALVFAHLDEGGTRPAEIARRAGISRQAVGQTVAQMHDRGLVKLTNDPTNRRARLVQPTAKGRRALERAGTGSAAAERVLARRIGASRLKGLRDALEQDWGRPR